MDFPKGAQVVGSSPPDGLTMPPGVPIKVEVAMFAGANSATVGLRWRVGTDGLVQNRTYDFPL
jgi:hypothetical protein